MNEPVIVVNFKTYDTAVGKRAVKLAAMLDDVSKETGCSIAVCASAIDVHHVAELVDIPVLCEHVDGVDFGSHTGKILAFGIKDNGGIGSLINHSEDRYENDAIKMAIIKLRSENLISIVCAKDNERAVELAKYEPDYIAVEPPELIGGDVSVTSANPQIVSNTVNAVKEVAPNIKVLCGAGVKTGEDVKKAIELGCVGVLLASGITMVDDPRAALLDMCNGLK